MRRRNARKCSKERNSVVEQENKEGGIQFGE
jgi:hypothetical protein